MNITEVRIKNFGPFGESESVEFGDNVLHIVRAKREDNDKVSNGCGKTTLFEAVGWCLFGKTSKGIVKDELIRTGEKNCLVRVFFDDNLIVVRRMGTSGTTLELHDDGKHKKFKTTTDAQAYLTERLGIDYEFWRNSFYASQQDVGRFIDATNKDKKDIFTKALGLDIYDRCQKVVKSKIKSLEETLAKLRGTESALMRMLEGVTEESDIQESREAIDEAEAICDATSVDITTTTAKIQKIEDKYTGKIKELEDTKTTLLTERAKLDAFSINKTTEINQLDGLGGYCPTCKQVISKKYKSSALKLLKQQAKTFIGEIKKAAKKVDLLTNKIGREHAKLINGTDGLQLRLTKSRGEMAKAHDLLITKRTELKAAERRLSETSERREQLEDVKTKIAKVHKLIEVNQFARDAFGINGLKSIKLASVVSAVGMEINSMLEEAGQDIRIRFIMKGGDLALKTVGDRSWNSLSGGEKQICGIFTYLAMTKLAARWTPMKFAMYDEILDQLDGHYAPAVVKLLREFAQDNGIQILMTSHRPDIKFKGFSRIHIEKGEYARFV